jgi:hypothetical protein
MLNPQSTKSGWNAGNDRVLVHPPSDRSCTDQGLPLPTFPPWQTTAPRPQPIRWSSIVVGPIGQVPLESMRRNSRAKGHAAKRRRETMTGLDHSLTLTTLRLEWAARSASRLGLGVLGSWREPSFVRPSATRLSSGGSGIGQPYQGHRAAAGRERCRKPYQ